MLQKRKVTNKYTLSRPKRPTAASASTKTLKKISNTKWIILCVLIIFIASIWIITSYVPGGNESNESNEALKNKNKGYIKYSKPSSPESYIGGIKTIYVSVATLGDHACPITINDLFQKAKYPQNIHVGIYQQNEGKDPDCLEMLKQCDSNKQENIIHSELGDITLLCNMKDNIVINRTNIKDGAKGPVYGRYMSMKLINKEKIPDFIAMIDSHTLFRKEWDEFTLKMWYSIEADHEHAVITHYPWGAEHLQKRIDEGNEYSYHICGSIYEGAPNYMVRNANGCFAKNAIKPVRVPFFAGGFSFAPTHFWQNVPLDPYLLYIFNGEEFDIATRGWTHGYDFYSPPTDIVGHYYDKGPKRRSPHVSVNKESHHLRDKSEKRLNYLWGLWEIRYPQDKDMKIEDIAKKAELRDLAKYGLGTKRTLSAFWKFAGIDPIQKNITIWKENLYAKGGLEYVPYN